MCIIHFIEEVVCSCLNIVVHVVRLCVVIGESGGW